VVALPAEAAGALPKAAGAERPVAVVELYTSEGCSSCPSADAVANALEKAARAEKRRVYVLAFHVDYWDDIGWPDPYADAAYTARQRERSRRAGRSGIYTPEAVVQGKDSFVGSDSSRMKGAVDEALKTPPSLVFQSLAVDVGAKTATWSVAALPSGTRLHLAVTEDGLSTDVRAGENAGRKLAHDGVVRSFRTTLEAHGTAPLGKLPNKGSVVAFVEGADGRVLGAQAVDLENGAVALR
jgi:hypothetical protein